MKIYKAANIFAFPFLVAALYIIYCVYLNHNSKLLVLGILPIMALILIYLFSPQINYWWLSKNPVQLDKPIIDLLNKTNPQYPTLNTQAKNEFNKRLFLFVEGKEFIGKGREEDTTNIPYDIKNLIAQIPVTMTLNQIEFTFKNFDRVVLYKHPFPTPQHQFLHTAETHAEDGVIILSLEHVQNALFNPSMHYDIAWHAFAEAYIKSYPNQPYPEIKENIWEDINKISPQKKDVILNTLGFKSIDPLPVLINLYFNYRSSFNSILPEISSSFDKIFNEVNRQSL